MIGVVVSEWIDVAIIDCFAACINKICQFISSCVKNSEATRGQFLAIFRLIAIFLTILIFNHFRSQD